MNKRSKEILEVEKDFFDFDEENKKIKVCLEFDKPSDLFDKNAITKIPVFNDDFVDWIMSAVSYTPKKYMVDVDVTFNDLEGYKPEELQVYFYKNVILDSKKFIRERSFKNKIAFGLIGLGLVLLVSMILMMSFWHDGGLAKEIISYVFDIATTVTIWEAMCILLVENKEKRDVFRNTVKKIDCINFRKKS